MTGRLANKTAVITGSSSGIGRAIAILFAKEGANIVCSDIREDPRPEMASETVEGTTVHMIEKLGGKATFVSCDATKEEDMEGLIKSAVDHFGRVDIMVNNAGVTTIRAPIWEFPLTNFTSTLAVNLTGVFLGTKHASLQMKSQEPFASSSGGDRGWIINIASILGTVAQPGIVDYVASKHGVMGITKTAAWDCAPLRIHVNALCPGYTETSLTKGLTDIPETKARLEALHPFKGLGSVDDVARAALFMASEDAGWVTGVGLPVDGGYTSF